MSIISRVQQMLRDSCAADSAAPRGAPGSGSTAAGAADAQPSETAVVANFMSLEAEQLWDHMTQRNGSDLQASDDSRA